MSGRKRYTANQILERAEELGIQIALEKGKIRLEADDGVISPKILQVIADHKEELRKALTPLCSFCLDAGKEHEALYEDREGTMYCEEHHHQEQLAELSLMNKNEIVNRFVQKLTELTGGCAVSIVPPGYTIQDRAHELLSKRHELAETLPHTGEELALVERLRPGCNMQLVQTPCPKCACRIERMLFGIWECANCGPYAGWSEQTLERIRATALHVQSSLNGHH